MAGGAHQGLWLLSADGSSPDPASLRDPLAWRWAMRGAFPIRQGTRQATLVGVAEGYGGGAVRALADRLHQPGTLRVGLGKVLGSAGALEGPEGLREALNHLEAMGLDALVPNEEELRLPPEAWAHLGARVPLLACNLKPLAGQQAPVGHVLRQVGGAKLALVGLADAEALRRRGLVGWRGAWQAVEPLAALREACAAAQAEGAEAILLLTNLRAEGWLALRAECPGVVAVLTADQLHPEADFQERIAPEGAEGQAIQRPWLVAGVSQVALGELTLELAPASFKPGLVPVALGHRSRLALDSAGPLPERSWRSQALRQAAVAQAPDALLPDAREVLPAGEVQHHWRQQGQLGASLLREALGAEVAVLPEQSSGHNTVGAVPSRVVAAWYANEHPVGSMVLTGGSAEGLAGSAAQRRGLLPGRGLARPQPGGRATLGPNESYREDSPDDLGT